MACPGRRRKGGRPIYFHPKGLKSFWKAQRQKVFENKLETLALPTNALTLQYKKQKIQTTPMRADNIQLSAERAATAQTQGYY